MTAARYDANLIVIGAGSAGLVSAYIAAAVRARVILIEKGAMGGDCLNNGCVPSKTLIASARHLHDMQRSDQFGFRSVSVDYDFTDVMERVQSVIADIAPHDSVERYSGLGVEVIQGSAEIISPHEVRVNDRVLSARSIIVATGGEPFVPAIEGIENIDVLTSDNIWELRKLPQNLLVLGGGPIGCELAQCFARFGSRVTMVEMLPRILAREDEEIAGAIAETLRNEGVDLRTGHRAEAFGVQADRKWLQCSHDAGTAEIEFDQVLVAVGRAPRLDGYGLEQLDIPLSQRRSIETNDYLQAGYPSIYACGDVVGPYQFTHVASHQAWYATVNALFRPFKKFRVDYSVIPWTTYTDPEVARVGLNEQEARERGIGYEVTRYDLSQLDRARADGDASGIVKVLTVPGRDRILGVTICGRHAGEMIAEFVLAMRHGLGLNKILQTIHAYPTWMEANRFVAGNWKRDHVPAWALPLAAKFHRWRLKK